jgi:hypothetical protein
MKGKINKHNKIGNNCGFSIQSVNQTSTSPQIMKGKINKHNKTVSEKHRLIRRKQLVTQLKHRRESLNSLATIRELSKIGKWG